jgi:hypothetical protein
MVGKAMFTLTNNQLTIRFPEVHPDAVARISFQRTLRIPDDGADYPLPPGMGEFPLHHVEDHQANLPETWSRHGGVFLPMYQSEALWISIDGGPHDYPIALQIAAGKINAVNGEPWQEEMQFDPQGYVVTGQQPWLDGFCVEKGRIRQFVAAPLGDGVTVEEQLTGEAEFGGIQIKAWPLKAKVYRELCQPDISIRSVGEPSDAMFCLDASAEMGLGMGGSMKQEIYDDAFSRKDWETGFTSRCFVHLMNSVAYSNVTGHLPPHRPYEAADYTNAGLPWFDYYSDRIALEGSKHFKGLKSWKDFHGDSPESLEKADIKNIVGLGNDSGEGMKVS